MSDVRSVSIYILLCLLTAHVSVVSAESSPQPKTFLRVTVGEVYKKPVYIHVFADHFRAPWYQHYHLSKTGAAPGLAPENDQLLHGGEQTGWCDITPMIYPEDGAILNITVRHTYMQKTAQLRVKLEFSTAANESSIVKTMDVVSQPNGLVVVMPPDLTTPENLARLKRGRDFAIQTGQVADSYDWPTFGKKPEIIPFFVTASVGGYGTLVDKEVSDREWKTLGYFGFSNHEFEHIHGAWYMRDESYCLPDLEKMKMKVKAEAEAFRKSGKLVESIRYCMLMDEPTGQLSSFAAKDPSYHKAFRVWLKKLGMTPNDLLLTSWDEVIPIDEKDRDQAPALHYFTQRFRTRALGDFMEVQRGFLENAYGRDLPTLVNFSDGATYFANFYGQGVDYFELLDSDGQNAIWSEDWANLSSSYQCAAYNVELMRAAARERGQVLGHYLIAHAGRKPWDLKLKAASETARGVRIWNNFSYGVSWGNHEGGPTWKSHSWYSKPETWRANAEVVREIGGAEDALIDSAADPAEVAILYSSSTDIWTLKRNQAYGFNRMHTWMALAHAQIPVDVLGERQVERDLLKDYKVCYLSGPNLSRAAALKLKSWVKAGGTLYLTAGAGSFDEYNRQLDTLNELLPAKRNTIETLQPFLNSGVYINILQPKDRVMCHGTSMDVLSVRQRQIPSSGSEVLASFDDGSAAIVRGKAGQGTVYSVGFLPALDYIRKALVARNQLKDSQAISQKKDDINQPSVPTPALELKDQMLRKGGDPRLERSYNPWRFSEEGRLIILEPVRQAGVDPELKCSVSLVDAVLLKSARGAVIPLANYTLLPIEKVEFSLRSERPVSRVVSVHQGDLDFKTDAGGRVAFSLPLAASDYVMVFYKE